jgi:hypothetical protein
VYRIADPEGRAAHTSQERVAQELVAVAIVAVLEAAFLVKVVDIVAMWILMSWRKRWMVVLAFCAPVSF